MHFDWHQLWVNVSLPDNVPIVLMMVLIPYYLWYGFREAVRNDRLIAVPETKKIKPRERTLADLPAGVLDQLEHFFVSYNRAEGRSFTPLARRGPEVALRLLEEGRRAYGSRATADVPRSGRAGASRKARAPSRSGKL